MYFGHFTIGDEKFEEIASTLNSREDRDDLKVTENWLIGKSRGFVADYKYATNSNPDLP